MIKFHVSSWVNNNTYITKKIDEGIVAAVRHGQPVTTEPDNVDVLITKENSKSTVAII